MFFHRIHVRQNAKPNATLYMQLDQPFPDWNKRVKDPPEMKDTTWNIKVLYR